MIIIDSREPNSLINGLKQKGLEIETDFIESGDYLLDDGFAIERKDKDLVQSIISNRLYEQLNGLCEYPHPILCIVMDNLWKVFYFSQSRWIHSAYNGMLTTLSISYPNLKVMQFSDEKEFMDYIVSLDKKIHKEGVSSRPVPLVRKPKSINERKENMLSMIEGLGISKAKEFINEFGTIENLCNADLEQLKKIKGVGKKLAGNVFNTLH